MKRNKLHLVLALILSAFVGNAQMVLEYDIETANTEIALPLAGIVNVSINWGDGSAVEIVNTIGNKTHTYATIGTKTVTINGSLSSYGNSRNSTGNARLTKVLSWDGLGITSFSFAFQGAGILTTVPTALPPSVTNLSCMFLATKSFNHNIGSWNTEAIKDMSSMFSGATAFNQNIGSWNTGAVTDMSAMFYDATAFNQNIGGWNTGSVTNMSIMFELATSFNQNIGSWNTGAVKDMSFMFSGAKSINQNIGSWNTGAVKDMSYMFSGATSFDKNIGGWDTHSVLSMSYMFSGATSFNQNIGNWIITSVTDMNYMFSGVTLCTENYDAILNGWSTQQVKPTVTFGVGLSKYSGASSLARAALINNNGWIIQDAGLDASGTGFCDQVVVGIEEGSALDALSIYPNPAIDNLQVSWSKGTNGEVSYQVYSTNGALVHTQIEQSENVINHNLNIKNLEKGAYVLKIISNDGIAVKSFVKE